MDDDIAIEEHVRAAQDAFWRELAMRFPELHTGDLAPDVADRFERACLEAAWAWLGSNVPSA